jgi:hypothetical protein
MRRVREVLRLGFAGIGESAVGGKADRLNSRSDG